MSWQCGDARREFGPGWSPACDHPVLGLVRQERFGIVRIRSAASPAPHFITQRHRRLRSKGAISAFWTVAAPLMMVS